MNNLSRRSLIRGAAVLPAAGLGLVSLKVVQNRHDTQVKMTF